MSAGVSVAVSARGGSSSLTEARGSVDLDLRGYVFARVVVDVDLARGAHSPAELGFHTWVRLACLSCIRCSDHGIVPAVEAEIRYYRARVTTLNDHAGIIHFLIQEEGGRSIEKSSFDVLDAAFLSSRFDSPLHEMVNRAELTEIEEETFAGTQGSRIPSDEVPSMTFWWMK